MRYDVRLKDARTVTLREATAEDVPRIVQLYNELTSESFRNRFYSGRPKPGLAERLARTDVVPGTVCVIAVTASEPDRLAGRGQVPARLEWSRRDRSDGAG